MPKDDKVITFTESQVKGIRGWYSKPKLINWKNQSPWLNEFRKPKLNSSCYTVNNITNKQLSDKMDDLNQRLDDIFGGHVLVKGRWVQIKESFQSILASIVGIKK